MSEIITQNFKQTQSLGKLLAKEIKGGAIICLSGELGSGKTTFIQGFLRELKIKGPHTSPTFVIMKKYKLTARNLKLETQNIKAKSINPKDRIQKSKFANARNVYHVDAYRVNEKDILNLGWEEIIQNNSSENGNIVLVEWAERIKKIIPRSPKGDFIWINFKWLSENERKITFKKS